MVGDLFTDNEAHLMPRKRSTARAGRNVAKAKRSVGSEVRTLAGILVVTVHQRKLFDFCFVFTLYKLRGTCALFKLYFSYSYSTSW